LSAQPKNNLRSRSAPNWIDSLIVKYLLDTNAVIALLNGRDSKLAKRARRHKPAECGISAIVVHELFYGAFKSQRLEANVVLIDGLQFEVLEFDKEDARAAGEIRAALVKKGKIIGPYNVLIAGQAKARNMILVTHNTKEFERVLDLRIEDWEI
jgi:tRNA(fMet)-specific endonuclease VapC